jgi:hypothetical protein
MSASGANREMDAADGYPLTIGRGSGFTLKEFNRKLNLWMKKKGMQPLTLGGGPARVKNPESKVPSPKPLQRIVRAVSDVWSEL